MVMGFQDTFHVQCQASATKFEGVELNSDVTLWGKVAHQGYGCPCKYVRAHVRNNGVYHAQNPIQHYVLWLVDLRRLGIGAQQWPRRA